MKKRLVVLSMVVCMLALWTVPALAQGVTGQFQSIAGVPLGTVTFEEGEAGLDMEIQVAGFAPVAGNRHVAITEVGLCEGPDFSSAGDETASLPDIQFYPNGSGELRATLDIDPGILSDASGSAVVIYADTGENPGERIACAVIAAATGEPEVEPAPEEAPAPDEEPAPEEETPAPPTGPRDAPVVDLPDPGSVLESDLPIPEPTEADRAEARALLESGVGGFFGDVNGRVVGEVVFLEDDEGDIHFAIGAVIIEGMNPVAGNHRAALVSTDRCEAPDFSTAGDEILELPEIPFEATGGIEGYLVLEGLQLSSLMDEDGTSMVLYEGNNENPGNRFLCAPLMSMEDYLASIGLTIDDILDGLGL